MRYAPICANGRCLLLSDAQQQVTRHGPLVSPEMAAATQHKSKIVFSQERSQESGKPQSQNQAHHAR